MLHEISFQSFNQRDQVQGWIYVPAAKPVGIIQLVHGFGEHSRRYLHMISKFLDAGFIVAADDHVGHGRTAVVNNSWGDWGDKGPHTMMEDEHTLTKLVKEKYPGLTTPDDSYHGVIYTERFGKGAFITKATAQLMRDFGSTPAPINSWIMGMHLESLGVRMERHCANALAVAEFLEADPRISWVSFPGLPSDRYHALAEKYMPNGTCGVIAFGVPGGREKVSAFLDHLKMISIATHVADARSCVLYPAGTTHRQLTEQQLEEAGVGIDLVRLSCGIENAADIIADVKQALDAVL